MFARKIFPFLVVTAFFSGCTFFDKTSGSGNVISKEFEFSNFSKLELSDAFHLEAIQSDEYSVVVHLDDNLFKDLQVSQKGDTLKVSMKGHRGYSVGPDSMRLHVSMPFLTGLDLSGASSGAIKGFKSDRVLDIEMSGASSLKGEIHAGETRFKLSGASNLNLKGTAKKLKLYASGASRADLMSYTVTADGYVRLSGASDADVKVQGPLSVDASGASTLTTYGKTKLNRVDTSGASKIEHR